MLRRGRDLLSEPGKELRSKHIGFAARPLENRRRLDDARQDLEHNRLTGTRSDGICQQLKRAQPGGQSMGAPFCAFTLFCYQNGPDGQRTLADLAAQFGK